MTLTDTYIFELLYVHIQVEGYNKFLMPVICIICYVIACNVHCRKPYEGNNALAHTHIGTSDNCFVVVSAGDVSSNCFHRQSSKLALTLSVHPPLSLSLSLFIAHCTFYSVCSNLCRQVHLLLTAWAHQRHSPCSKLRNQVSVQYA